MAADHLALPGLAEFLLSAALGRLRPLELGELVEYGVGEFALGAVVPAVVHGADPRPVLLELTPEVVVVRGLARDAVPVLGQHHGDAAGCHQVAHPVHAGPLQGGATVSGIPYLFEKLLQVFGCAYWRIADEERLDTTLRRRRDE